jgi:diguanylate cyclase (GGDEF)-like protein
MTMVLVDDHPVVQVDHRLIETLLELELELVEAESSAVVGSWAWDIATNIVGWSAETYRIFGLTAKSPEPTLAEVVERVHPDDRPRVEDRMLRAGRDLAPFTLRHRIVRPTGEVRHVETISDVAGDHAGTAERMHGTVLDRTEAVLVARRIEDVLGALELVRLVTVGVREADDLDGALQSVLDHVCLAQGWPIGRVWRKEAHDRDDLVRTEVSCGVPVQLCLAPSVLAMRAMDHHEPQARTAGGGAGSAAEHAAMAGPVGLAAPVVVDGHVLYIFEFEGDRDLANDNVVVAAVQSVCTIVARRIDHRRTARLLQEAQSHDPLTGLLTRGLFCEQARRALAGATRTGSSIAIFSIDLDQFRLVNAQHGHDRGDEVLVKVAERLRLSLRQRDSLARGAIAITRVGGDEFLALCEIAGDETAAVAIATRVLETVAAPIELDSGQVSLTARIGIAMSSSDSEPQQMILDAETAQRHARELGGARHQFFNAEHRERTASTSALVEALHHAVSADEFRLVYQPKISLETNRIVGVEALLRWDHPDRGEILPDDFIPAAEVSGVIVPIGAWVVREACRQAAAWRQAYPKTRLHVAVNVSARQFRSGLSGTLRDAVEETGINASSVCLEMTETTIMDDIDSTVEVLNELKSVGFVVSIDDFGTGYSSLEYLHRMPIDEVKIDRSFVAGLGGDGVNTAIVASVISLAHAMNLVVVAEGVETVEQLERLRTLGCDFAQGYLIATPMSPDAIDDFLAAESAGLAMPVADSTGATATSLIAETVLVVDDTADVRMLATMSLTAAGFVVEEAGNGAAALALARRIIPQCVLLDLSMPDISGIEVCRALRDDPTTAGCTIVMLSSHADPADKAEAFLVGADDYIVKPFTPRDLVARVRSAVLRRQSRIGVVDHVDTALVEMLNTVREQHVTDEALSDAQLLTSRQVEILRRLLVGERVPAIARELFLSQSTVRNHLSAIYLRIGVHSQEELLSVMREKASAPPSVDVDDHVS